MSLYMLRDGSTTDERTWEEKQGDSAYVQVATSTLANGLWISTLWLGVVAEADASPLIFESVVFSPDQQSLERQRYATEDHAARGHAALVAKWSG